MGLISFVKSAGAKLFGATEAKAAGAAIIGYGMFLNTVLEFIIVAFAIFLLVRQVNRMRVKPAPTTKECAYCRTIISLQATRCPHCTSLLKLAA